MCIKHEKSAYAIEFVLILPYVTCSHFVVVETEIAYMTVLMRLCARYKIE